jgi:hypothetical protein
MLETKRLTQWNSNLMDLKSPALHVHLSTQLHILQKKKHIQKIEREDREERKGI